MKCSIMLHFILVYTVCKGKKISLQKHTIFFENYNRIPLDRCNGLSKVYCIQTRRKNPLVYNMCRLKTIQTLCIKLDHRQEWLNQAVKLFYYGKNLNMFLIFNFDQQCIIDQRGMCTKRLFWPPYEAKKMKIALHKFLLISLLER